MAANIRTERIGGLANEAMALLSTIPTPLLREQALSMLAAAIAMAATPIGPSPWPSRFQRMTCDCKP